MRLMDIVNCGLDCADETGSVTVKRGCLWLRRSARERIVDRETCDLLAGVQIL
jgi:hypothetical protein